MPIDVPYFIVLLLLSNARQFNLSGEVLPLSGLFKLSAHAPCNNPLSGNVPYFIILLYLTPDYFTRQGESAAT